jgi:hypothetical protein
LVGDGIEPDEAAGCVVVRVVHVVVVTAAHTPDFLPVERLGTG